jgi:hypothetical protein
VKLLKCVTEKNSAYVLLNISAVLLNCGKNEVLFYSLNVDNSESVKIIAIGSVIRKISIKEPDNRKNPAHNFFENSSWPKERSKKV